MENKSHVLYARSKEELDQQITAHPETPWVTPYLVYTGEQSSWVTASPEANQEAETLSHDDWAQESPEKAINLIGKTLIEMYRSDWQPTSSTT